MRKKPRVTMLLVVVCILIGACGTRRSAPVVQPAPVQVGHVEAFIRRGCYTCLEAAFTAAAGSGLNQTAFETALLLVLRSKELGLPFSTWLDRARDHMPAGPEWPPYVGMVLTVPPDYLSADRDEILADVSRFRQPRAVLEAWRRALTVGKASSMFRAYLDLSVACGPLLYEQREAAVAAVLDAFGEVPLFQYRAGICGNPALLTQAIHNEPGFVDVHLELGRSALQRERPDYEEALSRFRLALAGFPTSATILVSIGAIHQDREEWIEALKAYTSTLMWLPSHRDALLGATVSFSQLLRHHEAIESASRILELGNWFIADAHYWRAWNEYRLNLIPAARADIDSAKALTSSAPTLVLSGIIAWREKRLAFAEAEFEAALSRDFGQCEAALYLGGVRAERQRWQEGLAAFQQAEQCFELAVVTRRKAIAELSATEVSAEAKARLIAAHERAILGAERSRAEAAQNATLIRRQLGANTSSGEPRDDPLGR